MNENERRNEIWEKELREGRNITVGIKNKRRNDWWEKELRWDETDEKRN